MKVLLLFYYSGLQDTQLLDLEKVVERCTQGTKISFEQLCSSHCENQSINRSPSISETLKLFIGAALRPLLHLETVSVKYNLTDKVVFQGWFLVNNDTVSFSSKADLNNYLRDSGIIVSRSREKLIVAADNLMQKKFQGLSGRRITAPMIETFLAAAEEEFSID